MIKQLSPNPEIAGVCVVGTGPVGMAIALEFDRLGADVVLLESGGAEQEDSDASRAEIVDLARHASMDLTVARGLGGTSWKWGGRCVPYDDIDWMPREYVSDAHWPLRHSDVQSWYSQAAKYMLCGNADFTLPYKRSIGDGLTLDAVERWSRDARIILKHRDRLIRSDRISLYLHSTVTGLQINTDETAIEGVEVATPQGKRTVRARNVILALGGIETTRLLLHVQQSRPRHFGGTDGPLGRYYMGHISGKIADIQFDRPADADDLDFKLEGDAWYRRRFMLTAETQLQNRLLNAAFWPDNPSFYDPSHGSGVLSSVFLALAFPLTGRRILPEAIRLAHTGPRPYKLGAHLKNAIIGAPRASADIYRILRDRFLRKPKKPGFMVKNAGGRYALHYHSEQVPNAMSRITLSGEKDEFGISRARIDLRYVDQDVKSVVDSHRILDRALRSNGLGRLEMKYQAAELGERIYEQAADGYHQVGTTRMGSDPRASVVDSDMKVHGIANLYVASSSVFPTAGQANSTFLAVAFAMRLVDHLQKTDRPIETDSRDIAIQHRVN